MLGAVRREAAANVQAVAFPVCGVGDDLVKEVLEAVLLCIVSGLCETTTQCTDSKDGANVHVVRVGQAEKLSLAASLEGGDSALHGGVLVG